MDEHLGEDQAKPKTGLMVAVVVVIVLGVLAWVMTTRDKPTASNPLPAVASHEPAADNITITFTDNGFNKPLYTVKQGGTVTVSNQSSGELEFASDDHAHHDQNSELNQPPLAVGQSAAFTVNKSGTWGIHDHLNADFTTKLVVE